MNFIFLMFDNMQVHALDFNHQVKLVSWLDNGLAISHYKIGYV